MAELTIAEALQQAIADHQAGRLREAEVLYRRILATDPRCADAFHLLGVLAHQAGEHEAAEALIREAIALVKTHPGFYSNLGEALRAQGKLDEAIAAYQQALRLEPDFTDALINLTIALQGQLRYEEATASALRVTQLEPRSYDAFNALGNAYRVAGRWTEAAESFGRALEIRPDVAEVHSNLGLVLMRQFKIPQAIEHLEKARILKPDFIEGLYNLGNAYRDNGESDKALECFQKMLILQPANASALLGMGDTCQTLNRSEEAVAYYRRAIENDPRFGQAYNNLGNCLKNQALVGEAIECYRKALEIDPAYGTARGNLIYTLLFQPGYDMAQLYAEHRLWDVHIGQPLAKEIRPHTQEPVPGRRLRVGYVSADFRNHVVGRNLVPLMEEHDRGALEIFCYSNASTTDLFSRHFQSLPLTWRDIHLLSDQDAAKLIRGDRIDILVDLSLHMAGGRMELFARKPAPVQVTFAGYPGTTGLSAIDYRLTDPYLDPEGLYDAYYSEKSLRLAHSFWCFYPLTEEPPVSPLPAKDRGYITFGNLNNLCKIGDEVLALWARAMHAVPQSRLVMLAREGAHRARMRGFLERQGIASERVSFAQPRARLRYLAIYQDIDIGLDSFPYNGHTTSLDSSWMGVPVVTLVGNTVASRAGLSQLSNLGMTELVARAPEEFIGIVQSLATNLDQLAWIRSTLRQRMIESPLMDGPGFARSIGAAYRQAWKTWCASAG